MIKVDKTLSIMIKIAPDNRKYNEKKEALRKKKPVKSLINSIINIIIKNLMRKIKALAL